MRSMLKEVYHKILLAVCLVVGFQSYSQALQDSLKNDDADIVSSIAPYPADVRDAILDVSQYPQKLVKIERIQSRTSQSFQDLISSYPRDVQEKFYDLSRYPELIGQLVTGSDKSPADVDNILKSYPPTIAGTVKELYPSHKSELQSMNNTYKDSEKTMNGVIGTLPDQAQRDFKKVVAMPDVMNLLTDRIDLTVSLGEAYKNDPQGVKQNLDSLNEELTAQNEKDLQDYKNKVASDPQLQEEMKKSAEDFAGNYDDVSAAGNTAPAATANQAPTTVVNNYYNNDAYAYPYPYWFGYPYWYASPVWYPRPLYYHTGFYIGGGGNLVVIGMPSYAYSSWFFGYGYRRYPRMYNNYNVYYNVHRTNITRGNVYRGFNTNARDHFYRANHIDNRNVNNGRQSRMSNPANTRSSREATRQNNVNRTQGFRNSINYHGNNFNSNPVRTFHAQEYHQQTWHSVGGGGSRMGGGGSAPRSSGGSFGGGHSGGGGGGGRRGR